MKALFLLMFAPVLAFAQTKSVPSEQQLRKIDSIIAKSYKGSEPGISYLIAQGPTVLRQKAVGMAEMEFQIPLQPDQVFAIGSVSKQFTAIAMLKLVEMGKVKLEDDIKTYIPDWNTHSQKITIANLLSHTAGIASFTEMPSFESLYTIDKTKEEIRECFEDSALLFKPNTNWSYSNSGYVLAAFIIEKVSGEDVHNFIQKNLFDVAGMSRTYFGDNAKIYGKKAYGYDPATDSTVGKAEQYSWTWPIGAGDILSTTGDMHKWHLALSDGKIISKELLKKAFSPYILPDGTNTRYGYGWGINKMGGKTVISHGGAIGGYLAETARIEEDQIFIILLTNTTAKSPGEILEKCLEELLQSPTKQPSLYILKNTLEEYVGTFEVNYSGARLISNMGDSKVYRYISTENRKLFVQRTGRGKVELLPYGQDQFFIAGSAQRFYFNRDKKGKVASVTVFTVPMQFGPDDVCKKVDVSAPVEKKEIKVSNTILQKYVGAYQLAPSFVIEITVEGEQIFAQATGQSKFEIFPKSETSFFVKVVEAQIDFNAAEDGSIKSLTLTQGRKMEAKKIR